MKSDFLYKNAPIKEAVFDLRLRFSNKPDLALFEKMYFIIKKDYEKKEDINSQTFLFDLTSQNPLINSKIGSVGLKLTSADGSRVLQIKDDGFTFSKLAPYENWNSFKAEAERLLKIYSELCNPILVERAALRYINSIKIDNSFPLSYYFNTFPSIEPSLKESMIQFFSRYLFVNKNDKSIIAVVNQVKGIEGVSDEVIFDIDVFKDKIELEMFSDDFWKLFEKLREFRTEIFENSITEKSKNLFN
jgi:uncharacterized protein (TIGR04255 family)